MANGLAVLVSFINWYLLSFNGPIVAMASSKRNRLSRKHFDAAADNKSDVITADDESWSFV